MATDLSQISVGDLSFPCICLRQFQLRPTSILQVTLLLCQKVVIHPWLFAIGSVLVGMGGGLLDVKRCSSRKTCCRHGLLRPNLDWLVSGLAQCWRPGDFRWNQWSVHKEVWNCRLFRGTTFRDSAHVIISSGSLSDNCQLSLMSLKMWCRAIKRLRIHIHTISSFRNSKYQQ